MKRLHIIRILMLLMMVIMPLIGLAQNSSVYFNKGLEYYFDNDYKNALFYFNKAAELGDKDAFYYLGYMYKEGEGVLQDYKKANYWFTKGAEKGEMYSQYYLGLHYLKGNGIDQNGLKALEFLTKAANQGLGHAYRFIGEIYYCGVGVTQNYIKAFQSFTKATDISETNSHSDPDSEYYLGEMYKEGLGVQQNYKKALEWFTKSASHGDIASKNQMGLFYYSGYGVEQDYMKAFSYFEESAQKGYASAQFNLGNMYYEGKGVNQDYIQAYNWLSKAAEQGNNSAKYVLGDMYYYGYGVNKDYTKALDLYLKAAEKGHPDAMFSIGVLYRDGLGVKKDPKKTLEWYSRAAKSGSFNAMMQMGIEYLKGVVFPKDHNKAEYWFKEAKKKDENHPWPYTMLAQLYVERDKNYTKALEYSNSSILKIDNSTSEEQAWYYGKRGEIYLAKGDFENAKKMLDKCIEKNPQYLDSNEDFAKMMKEANDKYFAPDKDHSLATSRSSVSSNGVDANIFTVPAENKNTFAVIIGNEKYKNEVEVPYAANDAKVFSNYVEKTLGVPRNHIKLIENASYNDLRISINWLIQAMNVCKGKGKAIVYYAGHGIPNEEDRSSYLLPVDGIGNDPESAFSLKSLYEKLGKVEAQSITIFLDACFSGSKREEGMLTSARGVAIKVKPSSVTGSLVVFSAAQGSETAYPYKDKQHGLFTYYLLKKLQETKGEVTLGEMSDYLTEEVGRESFVINGKVQTPTTIYSAKFGNGWRDLKMR